MIGKEILKKYGLWAEPEKQEESLVLKQAEEIAAQAWDEQDEDVPFHADFSGLPSKDFNQAVTTLEAILETGRVDPKRCVPLKAVMDNLEQLGYQFNGLDLPQGQFSDMPKGMIEGFEMSKDGKAAMAFRLENGQFVPDNRLLDPQFGTSLALQQGGVAIVHRDQRFIHMIALTETGSVPISASPTPSIMDGGWHTLEEDPILKRVAQGPVAQW